MKKQDEFSDQELSTLTIDDLLAENGTQVDGYVLPDEDEDDDDDIDTDEDELVLGDDDKVVGD